MTYPEFVEAIYNTLSEKLMEGVTIRISHMEKLNGLVRHGISFQTEGEIVIPTIYLEPFYEAFKAGKTVEALAREVWACYQEEVRDFSVEEIQRLENYKDVKYQLLARLIRIRDNERFLEEVPHLTFLDLAVVPYFPVTYAPENNGMVFIKNSHLEKWQIKEGKFWKDVLKSTYKAKGYFLYTMEEFLIDLQGKAELAGVENIPDMYVLTNLTKRFGAMPIYYPEVQAAIYERLGEAYYVLPSSVHELLIVRESQVPDPVILSLWMLRSIDKAVAKEDILSHSVYKYSAEKKELEICEV